MELPIKTLIILSLGVIVLLSLGQLFSSSKKTMETISEEIELLRIKNTCKKLCDLKSLGYKTRIFSIDNKKYTCSTLATLSPYKDRFEKCENFRISLAMQRLIRNYRYYYK